MNPKVEQSLNSVLDAFKTGDIVDAVTYAMNPVYDLPMNKWSFRNTIIALLHGTSDARGFRQWKAVNRSVKKGAKAFYILAPYIKTEKETDENGEEKETSEMLGYFPVPVFRFEDTEGEELYPELKQIALPRLSEVADRFGVSIEYLPRNGVWAGFYSPGDKNIGLCTPEENVFFHELAHAAHDRVIRQEGKYLTNEKHWRKETVAELAACVISRTFGRRLDGNAYQYIEQYTYETKGKNVHKMCMSVLSDVRAVLNEIFQHVDDSELENAA